MLKKTAVIASIIAIASCSAQQTMRIATSRNPQAALESIVKNRPKVYAQNPMQMVADVKRAKKNFNKAMSFLMKAIGKEWGKDETKLPSQKKYVKYTQNYQSRAMVDFDNGLITVETLDEKNTDKSLKNAIVTTLLTPEDPRSVDLFSDKKIKLSGKSYLDGLVVDNRKRNVNSPKRAEEFADWLMKNRKKERIIKRNGKKRKVTYAEFAMASDYENRSAKKYEKLVSKYAKKFKMSKSLVYGIIKTESNFNPYAVSHVPAYGLMQLVPSSGGRDAYRAAKGKDKIPSKEYLFVPENNIELGSAYLAQLDKKYFRQLGNPVSREYCVISGYNTGPGNVLRTFSKDKTKAISVINSLEPPGVYWKLRKSLPYKETRDYLVKVVNNRKKFVSAKK